MDDLIRKLIQKLDTVQTPGKEKEDINYIFGYIKATIDDIEIIKGEMIDG